MIKINLASRKQAPGVASGGGGGGENTRTFQTVYSKLMAMQGDETVDRGAAIRRLIFFMIIVAFAEFSFEDYKETETKKITNKLTKANAELTRLRSELATTSGYEETKRELEGDEKLIRTKIDTIKTLISRKTQPSKMLISLSSGIPQQVWLSEFKITDGNIQMKGLSSGFDPISDFLKSLDESAYFADLTLVNSQQEKDELGVESASFEISAKRRSQQ